LDTIHDEIQELKIISEMLQDALQTELMRKYPDPKVLDLLDRARIVTIKK
jgi:hypothetical protein